MASIRKQCRSALRLKGWIFALCFSFTLLSPAADRTYVVKRNDTLSGIAQLHGITTTQLADRNGISRNTQIYAGQRLIVPNQPSSNSSNSNQIRPTTTTSLSASLQSAIKSAPVSPRRWKYIVLHHSGADEGNLKSIDRYHREERHMENGLAYHFLIGNGNGMGDGEIAVGNRWKEQLDGGHLRSDEDNKIALGICLIGNFDNDKPTAKQLRSLEDLTRALMKRCALSASAVKTHQQINVVHTKCPGSKFPTRTFLAKLKPPTR